MAKRHNSIILCGHIILGMKPPQIFGMTPPMDLSERIVRSACASSIAARKGRATRVVAPRSTAQRQFSMTSVKG